MLKETIVIACAVLQAQIEELGSKPYDFIYLKQGLHRTPELLRIELQEMIDSSPEYSRILLGYGLCSRAMIGLKAAEHQTLIIPKIDDCIGISMGSRARYYQEFNLNPGTYYFTKGWVEAASDPLKEFHETKEKYGNDWRCGRRRKA